ncbi:MAG TPA: HAMP domain-containing sensor histidine kinase [Pseudonocardiaceae bacterium]
MIGRARTAGRVAPWSSRLRHHDDALVRRTGLRLGALAALGAAAIVAALTVVALVELSWTQDATQRALLADIVRVNDSDDLLPGTWLWMRGPTDVEVTPGMPAGLPLLDALQRVTGTEVPDVRHISLAAGEFAVRTEVRDGVLKQAVVDLEPDRVRREAVVRALLVSGGAGLLLTALGGVWMGRRAVRPLADALALQRRFVADASHELRTPVTLLSTRAQLMRRALHAGADLRIERGELDGLVEDTAALGEVLEDLLLAADPGAETGGAVVDLVEMARQVAASATSAAQARGIALSCTDGPAVAAIGSRAALRRAMTALVDNAIRHARSDVRLSVTVAGHRALVDVCDDGPGVDPEILPRLFERFASSLADEGLPDNRRRYGIGLALVSEVAARHGGTVTAAASPGPGASIRLTLPLIPAVPRKLPERPRILARTPTR